MLYKLVPPSMKMGEIQYIDGASDAKVVMTLQGKGMTVVQTPPKKVGQGQTQIGYCRDPQFALVRVESSRLAMRVVEKVASKLRLGPAQQGPQEIRNSAVLKTMKKFRKRPQGDLASAIEVAAGFAKATGKDAYVWKGNSFMHAVWNVSDRESKALVPFSNIGQFVYRVTPGLDIYGHEVLGRLPPPPGVSEE